MSKNIETSIINYVPLYQTEAKFTKLSQNARKKSLDKSINQLDIMKSLYYGRQPYQKTLNRTIPDLYQVPPK